MNRAAVRMKKELEMLSNDPPPGISCYQIAEKLDELEATIKGCDKESPFVDGIFKLSIAIPKRYPFEPPLVKFITPIYHPNIDNAGRICLDLLKMPPKGSWKPSINISTLLKSIQLLMDHPNPDDPLMADIAQEFISNKRLFHEKAQEWTTKHAKADLQYKLEKTASRKRTSSDSSEQRSAKKVLTDAN